MDIEFLNGAFHLVHIILLTQRNAGKSPTIQRFLDCTGLSFRIGCSRGLGKATKLHRTKFQKFVMHILPIRPCTVISKTITKIGGEKIVLENPISINGRYEREFRQLLASVSLAFYALLSHSSGKIKKIHHVFGT